jgi:hypothetical protein
MLYKHCYAKPCLYTIHALLRESCYADVAAQHSIFRAYLLRCFVGFYSNCAHTVVNMLLKIATSACCLDCTVACTAIAHVAVHTIQWIHASDRTSTTSLRIAALQYLSNHTLILQSNCLTQCELIIDHAAHCICFCITRCCMHCSSHHIVSLVINTYATPHCAAYVVILDHSCP